MICFQYEFPSQEIVFQGVQGPLDCQAFFFHNGIADFPGEEFTTEESNRAPSIGTLPATALLLGLGPKHLFGE